MSDIHAYLDDTTIDEYKVRFVGAATDARDDYLVSCDGFAAVSKEMGDVKRQIWKAVERAYGADWRTDTPYIFEQVLRSS